MLFPEPSTKHYNLMNGHIHSIETFGAVDGPGVRFVIFFQGCPMRCAYCHNPDTWNPSAGDLKTVDELWERFERNRVFYGNGGVTATGGEPLMQIDFLIELFTKFHENGIHTCLDTSAVCHNPSNPEWMKKINALLKVTDLVMLDIKHIDALKHKELTGHSNENILAFAKYLSDAGKELWVRHVLVPGITDSDEDLYRLGAFLGELTSLQALDVLPYHTMGIAKYEKLGIPYPLKDVPPADKSLVLEKKQIVLRAINETKEAR